VAAAVSRAVCVGHHDGHGIVFKQNSSFELQEAKLDEDSFEIFRDLNGVNDSHKLALSSLHKLVRPLRPFDLSYVAVV
jgi:hypothetical protein